MPKVEFLSDIRSKVYFCREAALVRLRGGLNRIACRDYGEKNLYKRGCYDLYMDGVPLVETLIDDCETCGTLLLKGYGDGIYGREDCAAVSEKLNGPYRGLKNAVADIAPILGLLKSGLYIVADFDLLPVINKGSSCSPEYFWDVTKEPVLGGIYHEELHFVQYDWGGEDVHDFPMLLAPSQRASLMNMDRVAYYRGRLGEGESFPRAVALYLNGAVALLLNGHHKAAACALEGAPVRTLVIFRANGDERALSAAAESGKRLCLCLGRSRYSPRTWGGARGVVVCTDRNRLLSGVSCLQTMEKRRVRLRKEAPPAWGKVPPELYTESWKEYPEFSGICFATQVPPHMIQRVLKAEKDKPEGTWDEEVIRSLMRCAELFPDTEWLSREDVEWLKDAYRRLQ